MEIGFSVVLWICGSLMQVSKKNQMDVTFTIISLAIRIRSGSLFSAKQVLHMVPVWEEAPEGKTWIHKSHMEPSGCSYHRTAIT